MSVDDRDGLSSDLSILKTCLAALQAQAAQVIRLRYQDQKSCQKIAESMQHSVTWVTTTLSRARKALRECMAAKLGEEAAT